VPVDEQEVLFRHVSRRAVFDETAFAGTIQLANPLHGWKQVRFGLCARDAVTLEKCRINSTHNSCLCSASATTATSARARSADSACCPTGAGRGRLDHQ